MMDAPEGCTAISDRNGVVVFYTDGNDVFIKDKVTGVHSLVDSGIGGDPTSAQSVVSVPFPNDETLYYIFTTEEIGSGTGNFEFKYSVFDIKLSNGAGGIAEKDMEKIWDRLFRADKSRSQRGLGLGLSLVKAIVEAHEGYVEVKSQLGLGSVFTVAFKARLDESKSENVPLELLA